jgi:nucleotide-binding universal stress UspA family protein
LQCYYQLIGYYKTQYIKNWVYAIKTTKHFKEMHNKIKTILVPTDYSETAKNAAEYAIELAKNIKAKIVLLHVFDVPVTVTDIPVVINTFDDFEKIKKEQLKVYEQKLIAKYGTEINISSVLKPGYINDEINDVVKQKNIDLIVMGITGVGRLPELIIGSNVSRVIKSVECPTITVHENVKYEAIKKIAFACDYDDIEDSQALDKLIEFTKLLSAKLLLINIVDPSVKPTYKKTLSASLLEHVLDKVEHTVSFRKNEDIIEGINNFVDHHKIDMLVMLPKKHSIFSRLFHESNTKKMAFHTHVPLLTIHN